MPDPRDPPPLPVQQQLHPDAKLAGPGASVAAATPQQLFAAFNGQLGARQGPGAAGKPTCALAIDLLSLATFAAESGLVWAQTVPNGNAPLGKSDGRHKGLRDAAMCTLLDRACTICLQAAHERRPHHVG